MRYTIMHSIHCDIFRKLNAKVRSRWQLLPVIKISFNCISEEAAMDFFKRVHDMRDEPRRIGMFLSKCV